MQVQSKTVVVKRINHGRTLDPDETIELFSLSILLSPNVFNSITVDSLSFLRFPSILHISIPLTRAFRWEINRTTLPWCIIISGDQERILENRSVLYSMNAESEMQKRTHAAKTEYVDIYMGISYYESSRFIGGRYGWGTRSKQDRN